MNVSRSIDVGAHVWLAKHCVVMGGVTIGDGSVIGFRSIVTRSVPNNCVAVGAPARVVRRDVAWARPETVARKPGELYPHEGEIPEQYWNLSPEITAEDSVDPPTRVPARPRVARPTATARMARAAGVAGVVRRLRRAAASLRRNR